MPTPKQEKLIKLIIDNYGIKGSSKTMGEMLKEAGYSEGTVVNPKLIFESDAVQEGISDFVDKLKDKREKALKYLTDSKLDDSDAKDLSDIIDKFTKNIQLLTGGDTEKHNINIGISEQVANRYNLNANVSNTNSSDSSTG
jgi:hypothetical protein